MSTHGQRFRRRALRRGYKVDEVDVFLDQVEATLSGEPTAEPMTAQKVHDVVFRVRFGGYDEWQVDLHLDRVERQLAEMEERGTFGRPQYPGAGDQTPLPTRTPLPERVPLSERQPVGPDRYGAPVPVDHYGAGDRPGGPSRYGAVAEPYATPEPYPAPEPYGPPEPDRFGGPGRYGAPDRYGAPAPDRMGSDRMGAPGRPPGRDDRGFAPAPAAGRAAPPTGMPPAGMPPAAPMPAGPGVPPVAPMPQRTPGYTRYDDATTSFNGFEAGRRARADMTSEIRMPEAATPLAPPAEVQRIDHMRRAFMPRRFGSGYDPAQVDQVFEGIIAALSGRSGVPIRDAELDPAQFSLVPGGYFEAEVDAALKEVRDLMRRR